MQRREFIRWLAASGLMTGLISPASAQVGRGARIVVVGGSFAGATCAKYIRRWAPGAEVTLVEAASEFVSCPMSNRVISGAMSVRDLTRDYDALQRKHGITVVHDRVTAIDAQQRSVRLARGPALPYDRLVMAPGIDVDYSAMAGLESEAAQQRVPHGWKAGQQTHQMRRMLGALPKGGVYAIHVPAAPYRCPPGPYERACLVASSLQRTNPTAKVLVFDANPQIVAKRGLFSDAFAGRYKNVIEYVPNAAFERMDVAGNTVDFDLQKGVRADVWNPIPPQHAGEIARSAGLANVDRRWCEVDFLTYESRVVPGIHVLGDAIASAPGMPKSAHLANQQAKVCAAAIAAMLAGRPVVDQPMFANTCYSFISEGDAMHINTVYRYDAGSKTMVDVPGGGGVSREASSEEAFMAVAWAFNILNDTLA